MKKFLFRCIVYSSATKKYIKKHSKNDILKYLTKLERFILTMQDNNNINFKKIHYKHLTSPERGQIQAYLNEGKSIRFIAK